MGAHKHEHRHKGLNGGNGLNARGEVEHVGLATIARDGSVRLTV